MTAARKLAAAVEPEPQDGKPGSVEAREAEAGDGFAIIEQCGIELRIPLKGKVPIAAIDLYRAGDNYGALKARVGEDQWRALSDAGMTDGDLLKLDEKIAEAAGN